jgi:hypothetical protein
MGRACSTHRRETEEDVGGKARRKSDWDDLDIDGSIILKCPQRGRMGGVMHRLDLAQYRDQLL